MRKWLPLTAVCLGSFLFLLDTTVAIVAAPRVAMEMPGGTGQAAWVVNSYTLVLAMVMLPAGGWADRIGHDRVFIGGLLTFAAASLGCGWSPTFPVLVVCRGIQGLGGAAIAVTGFTLSVASYAGAARGRAMGVFFGINGLGAAVGPLVGGLLTDALGWRAIFIVNVPYALATAWLARGCLPHGRRVPGGTDWPGVALLACGIGSVTVGLANVVEAGWFSGQTVFPIATGVAALSLFAWAELRATTPLMNLRLFQRPAFIAAMLAAATSSVPFAALVYTSVWLQQSAYLSPAWTGLALMPLAGTVCVVSILGGSKLHRLPPAYPIGIGLILVAGGSSLQAVAWASTPIRLIPGLVVTGVGIGLIGPTLGLAVGAATPPEHIGMGSAAMTTLRQLGQSIAVAALSIPFGEHPAGDGSNLHATQLPVAAIACVAGVATLSLLPRHSGARP